MVRRPQFVRRLLDAPVLSNERGMVGFFDEDSEPGLSDRVNEDGSGIEDSPVAGPPREGFRRTKRSAVCP